MLNLVALADTASPPLDAAWLDEAAATVAATSTGAADAPPTASNQEWTATAHALDADDGSSYVGLVCAGHDTALVVKLDGGQPLWVTPIPAAGGALTGLVHVLELEAVVVATAAGDLLTLSTADGGLEEVGSIAGGVAALAWSPTGDRVALISGVGRLLVMDATWTLLADVAVFAAWPTPVPARVLPPDDSDDGVGGPPGSGDWAALGPGDAGLAWRADGRALVTTTRRKRVSEPEASVSCTLRTWDVGAPGADEEISLHALGESVPGLASPVSWQPNARHIYGVAVGEGGAPPRIVLFERNGLTHGGFGLGGASCAVSSLSWSPDSEVLAVGLRAGAVQLWRRSNWHWYLKREVRCEQPPRTSLAAANPNPPAALCAAAPHHPPPGPCLAWDECASLSLRIAHGCGNLRSLRWTLDVTVSTLGTAAVVDGPHVLLTPLQLGVPPPPLAAVALACPAPVTAVALSPYAPPESDEQDGACGCEVAVAALADGTLAVAASPAADEWEGCLDGKGEAAPPPPPLAPGDPAGEYEHDRVGVRTLAVTPEGWCPPGAGVRDLAWLSASRLLVLVGGARGPLLVELEVDAAAATAEVVSSGPALDFDAVLRVAAVPPTPESGAAGAAGVLVEAGDGRVAWCVASPPGAAAPSLHPLPALPAPCPTLRAWPGHPPLPVGLTPGGDLFLGGRHVAAGTNSVAVRPAGPGGAFLLYTSADAVLRCLPSALALDASMPLDGPGLRAGHGGSGPDGGPKEHKRFQMREGELRIFMHKAMKGRGLQTTSAGDPSARAVEAGAALVGAPPGGSGRVVLQMPRGNLETVCPRALVLTAVATDLVAGRYAPAAAAVATHRLDPNILVDVGWPAFLSGAASYVSAVVDDAAVSDLLRALRPGSTVAPGGVYAWVGTHVPGVVAGDGDASIDGKVASVARALRSALTAAGPARYLRPVLTSHAILGDLGAALALVKARREVELAEGEIEGGAAAPAPTSLPPQSGEALGTARRAAAARSGAAPPPTADAGLRHLLLTVPFDDLYAAALAAYDLPVAYLVALAAGRDPAEHLVDLRAWGALPDGPLRRHAIDAHLGRHDRALSALIEAGPEHLDAALDLAAARGLLRDAVGLLDGAGGDDAGPWADPAARSAARAAALRRYAADLRARGRPEDAALACLAASDPDGAIDAYRAAGQATPALALAARQGWPRARVRALAGDLADGLAAVGRFADAAAVAARHLDDADSAVAWLAKAHEWRAALGAAYEAGRDDLVETVLAPAAAEAAASILADARDDAARVAKYLARYKGVQDRRKALDEAVVASGGRANGAGDSDTGAVAADDDDDGRASAWGAGSDVSGLSAYTTTSTLAGGLAPSSAASTAPPSTIGGRPALGRTAAQKKKKAAAKKAKKIRAGGAAEETALAEHIASLAPRPAALVSAGELAELLVLLGHESDGRTVQAALAALVKAQAAAAEHLAAHPPVAVPAAPDAKPVPPPPSANADVRWKWDLLRPVNGVGGGVDGGGVTAPEE